MSIKTSVIVGVTSALTLCSAAFADLAIHYDSCGFRSLTWDAVAGAATYRVERKECDNCMGEWKALALGAGTSTDDLDSPALAYRVRALSIGGVVLETAILAGDGVTVQRLSIGASSAELPSVACGEQLRLEVDAQVPPDHAAAMYEWRGNGVTIATTVTPYVDMVVDSALSGAVISVVVTNGCGTASLTWSPYVIAGMPQGTLVRWASLFHEDYTYEWSSQLPNCYWCCGGQPPGSCECSSCYHEQTNESLLTNTPCNPSGLGVSGAIMNATAGGRSNGFYHGGVQYNSIWDKRENWYASGILAYPSRLRVQYSLGTDYGTKLGCNTTVSITSSGTTVWTIDGSSPPEGVATITMAQGLFDIRVDVGGCQTSPGPWGVSASLAVDLQFLPPDVDCNSNLRPDATDITSGLSADIDANNTPDECQTVTVPGQYASIQAAIDAAPSNEMRIISVAAGTYAGPIAFNGKPVVVRGAGASNTVIDGTGGQPLSVVRFTGGEPAIAALEGVTVRHGATGTPFPGAPQFLVGGGVFSYNSAASIYNCVIEENSAAFGAGAYFRNSTGKFQRVIVRSNTASDDAGGIQLFGGSPQVIDSIIEQNTAGNRGGGMHLVQGTPTLMQTIVRNNQSSNAVGGLSWVPASQGDAFLRITNCTIRGNTAINNSGGIGILADGDQIKTDIQGADVCANTPDPNITGAWNDLGANTVCSCPGDLNLDGIVDGGDMGVLLSSWGFCGASCPYDLNNDGNVNGGDLGLLLSGWGNCPT